MTEPIKLPPPHGYIYVWDGPYGTHRLTARQYNGRQCDRTVAYYTEAQVRKAIEADRQARGEPVAWLCTPDFEGEQFLATTQGAADTLEKDGWSVQPLYDTPQPKQQARGEPVDPETCSDEVYKKGVSIGLFDIPKGVANAICAGISSVAGVRVDWHYIGGRVHMKALPAPQPTEPSGAPKLHNADSGAQNEVHDTHPQQIPEGYKLVPVEPTEEMLSASLHACDGNAYCCDAVLGQIAMNADRYKAMLEAAPEPKEKA